MFEKIDTSAIYLAEFKWVDTGEPHIDGYKFYSDNRVAFFIDIEIGNINELDPRKAKMGYYSTCSEKNTIQIAYHHVQSGVYKSKKEFEINNDTLILNTLKSPHTIFRIEKYYKIKLKTSELIYKPDW